MRSLTRHFVPALIGWWGATAYAASSTFESEFGHIRIIVVVISVIVALAGGTASTLLRVREAINSDRKIKSLPLEVATDMVVSLVAGLGAFFATEVQGTSSGYQFLAILIAAFSGAKGVAWVQTKWMGGTTPTPP